MSKTTEEPLLVSSIGWIQDLYLAAKLTQKESSKLSQSTSEQLTRAICNLERSATRIPKEKLRQIIDLAQELYEGDDVIVDTDGLVYHNDEDGYWVQAGVFVGDIHFEEEEGGPCSSPV